MCVLSCLHFSSASRPVLHRCPFLRQHQPLFEPHVRAQLVCLSSVHHTPGPPFPTRCLLCQWEHQGRGRARVRLKDFSAVMWNILWNLAFISIQSLLWGCFMAFLLFHIFDLYLFVWPPIVITLTTLQWSPIGK